MIVPMESYFQTRSTLTKAEIEIITNLISARWPAAYAHCECEKIGEARGRRPAENVERIIAAVPISFDDPREQVIYELASALATPRIVTVGLYKRAKKLIGEAGIVDVVLVIGWFTMVSATLNAFDAPSNAVLGPRSERRWARPA
jgi:4-carboxymuconolactone decarboxylase